ncbi:MAG: type II secretion system protein [Betaproteobacteria bacterium]|nr:type II secretion system protein [Betaproteobacteria bacterium]
MKPRAKRAQTARRDGFTLVELAIALAVVALLAGGLLYTVGAQTEQRRFDETRRRLDRARELVLGFAVMNGRLPCPARSSTLATEVRDAATGRCWDGAVEDYYGGSLAGGATGGLLPAASIGFPHTDAAGFAIDAWGNRLRYAVAKSVASGTCAGSFTNPHWVNAANMKANGIGCQPGDLLICKSAAVSPALSSSSCGGTPVGSGANQITAKSLVAALVFSLGPNGRAGATGADEAANLDGGGNADPVFVFHAPTGAGSAGGEFDDQFSWISVGELYGRLITARLLP